MTYGEELREELRVRNLSVRGFSIALAERATGGRRDKRVQEQIRRDLNRYLSGNVTPRDARQQEIRSALEEL